MQGLREGGDTDAAAWARWERQALAETASPAALAAELETAREHLAESQREQARLRRTLARERQREKGPRYVAPYPRRRSGGSRPRRRQTAAVPLSPLQDSARPTGSGGPGFAPSPSTFSATRLRASRRSAGSLSGASRYSLPPAVPHREPQTQPQLQPQPEKRQWHLPPAPAASQGEKLSTRRPDGETRRLIVASQHLLQAARAECAVSSGDEESERPRPRAHSSRGAAEGAGGAGLAARSWAGRHPSEQPRGLLRFASGGLCPTPEWHDEEDEEDEQEEEGEEGEEGEGEQEEEQEVSHSEYSAGFTEEEEEEEAQQNNEQEGEQQGEQEVDEDKQEQGGDEGEHGSGWEDELQRTILALYRAEVEESESRRSRRSGRSRSGDRGAANAAEDAGEGAADPSQAQAATPSQPAGQAPGSQGKAARGGSSRGPQRASQGSARSSRTPLAQVPPSMKAPRPAPSPLPRWLRGRSQHQSPLVQGAGADPLGLEAGKARAQAREQAPARAALNAARSRAREVTTGRGGRGEQSAATATPQDGPTPVPTDRTCTYRSGEGAGGATPAAAAPTPAPAQPAQGSGAPQSKRRLPKHLAAKLQPRFGSTPIWFSPGGVLNASWDTLLPRGGDGGLLERQRRLEALMAAALSRHGVRPPPEAEVDEEAQLREQRRQQRRRRREQQRAGQASAHGSKSGEEEEEEEEEGDEDQGRAGTAMGERFQDFSVQHVFAQLERSGKFEQYVALAEALVRAHVQAAVAQQQQSSAGVGINKVVYDVPSVLLLYWRQLVACCVALATRSAELKRFETCGQLLRHAACLIEEEVPALPGPTRTELRAYVDDAQSHQLYSRGRYAAALAAVRRARKVHAGAGRWGHAAACWLHEGCVLSRTQRHGAAAACAQRVLDLVQDGRLEAEQRTGGADAQRLCMVAVAYHNLAVEQLFTGQALDAALSSQNARRLARLCLAYSTRWLRRFEVTQQRALGALASAKMEGASEEERRVYEALTHTLGT